MVQRLTYRTRHSYATKSNQHRVVKTPGMYIHFLDLTKRNCTEGECYDFGFSDFGLLMDSDRSDNEWFLFVMGDDLQVGSWCIKAPRRGQVGPSVLLLERGSKGYVFASLMCPG